MPVKYTINLERTTTFQYIIASLILVMYVGVFCVPLTDNDAAHHANIALHMHNTKDYVYLIDRGNDYLDKPHFLFWISSLSFNLFGVNTFAYRLPPLIFGLMSVYSVYRLTLHLSDKTTAKLAALIISTAQAFIFSIVDARMEAPLTAAIAFGLWQAVVYIDDRKFNSLLLAALGAAVAFDTKGWIGVIIILISCFFKLWLEHKWNRLASAKTWLFIPFFVLFISPVLYAYYLQFDLHPEKVIRNMHHISGMEFILWNQNIERFDGDNWVQGGRFSSPFYFLHTFLWAFAPWCIAAYIGIAFWLRRMFYKKKYRHPFNFSALSFAFILVAISLSKFKMPHYILMLFPLAAVLTAPYLRLALSGKWLRLYYSLHTLVGALIIVAVLILNFYFFQPVNWLVAVVGWLLIVMLVISLLRKTQQKAMKVLHISALSVVVLNFFMFYNFFPNLMQYQGGNKLAEALHSSNINSNDILLLDTDSHSFDFYMAENHATVSMEQLTNNDAAIQHKYFLLNSSNKRLLEQQGLRVAPVYTCINYQVSKVKLKFLNPSTRMAECDSLMIARVYRH